MLECLITLIKINKHVNVLNNSMLQCNPNKKLKLFKAFSKTGTPGSK